MASDVEEGARRDAAMALLNRYGDPKAFLKAHLAIVERVRSGEYKRGLGKDATPEQLAAWRQENGVPTDFKEYGTPLPEGLDPAQLNDAAKGRFEHFNKGFQELNLPKEVVGGIYKLYNDMVIKDAEATAQADATLIDSTSDALIADWGPQFRGNLKMNSAYLDQELGKEMTDLLMDARFPDGRKVMDVVEIAKWINKVARDTGGDIMVGEDTGGHGASVEAQIEAINQIMRTDMNKYIAEGHDKKLANLLAIQEKRGKLPTFGNG